MNDRYTAKLYCKKKVIAKQQGDDLDALHSWLLAKTEDKYGNYHGNITDNESGEPVRSFKKCPPD